MRHILLLPLMLALLLLSLAPPSPTRKQEGKDEKRFTLDVKGKTWPEVFQWLSDATGKPIIASCRPTRTCHVTTPPDRRYTLNQVIDLLNMELLGKDQPTPVYLVPRDRYIALLDTNPIDKEPAPVPIDALVRFPRTEIVSIVLRLKTLKAADMEPRVRKMMGPYGYLVVLKGANRLAMRDQVANLRRIVLFIRNLDRPHKP